MLTLSPEYGGEGRRPGLLAALLALPAVAVFFSPRLSAALQFDRAAIASGELWRLVTCHWTHWSLDHLLWDVAAFAVLTFACAARCPRRLVWTLGLSSLAIPAAVWLAIPDMQTYRGLSGLASALLVLLMVDVIRAALRRGAAWACGALLVGFAAKVAYEAVTGDCVFADASAAGFVPVPLAHAAGAVVGAAAGLAHARRASQGSTSRAPCITASTSIPSGSRM